MKALTALDWRYRGWIYNHVHDRWESLDNVMPHAEHNASPYMPAKHRSAENRMVMDGHFFRKLELSDVPDPT